MLVVGLLAWHAQALEWILNTKNLKHLFTLGEGHICMCVSHLCHCVWEGVNVGMCRFVYVCVGVYGGMYVGIYGVGVSGWVCTGVMSVCHVGIREQSTVGSGDLAH